MAKFTEFGFERDALQTLVEEERQKLITLFGLTINIDDEESVFYQLATNNAERRFQNQQMIEEILSNLTIAGAEGIYLDNILNKVVSRLGPTQGTVDAYIEYTTTPTSETLPTTTLINTKDGRKYYPISEVVLYDNVVAFSLTRTDLKTNGNGATYVFNGTEEDGTPQTLSQTVTNANDNSELDAKLATIASWFISVLGVSASRVHIINNTLKVGYDANGNLIGLGWEMEFDATSNIGTKNSLVPAIHEKAGYYPINPSTVSSVSPAFTGYTRASNPYAGTSGSDSESDAEYIVRHRAIALDPVGTTREGLVRALLESGITKVAVQTVPASVTAPYTHTLGFTVYPSPGVIIFTSGSPTDGRTVGRVIYDSIPIGVDTSGLETESITPSAGGGQVAVMRWTEATNVDYDFRVDYTPLSGGNFSANEQLIIKTAITDVLDSIDVGGTLYTTQLDTAILKALSSNRLLSISTKGRIHATGSYVAGTLALASASTYFSTQDSYITFAVV